MSDEEQSNDDFLRDQVAAINAQARALVAQSSGLLRMLTPPRSEAPRDDGPNYMGKDD